ncbi:MAG: CheY-like chemotaxis protein [Candidatus Azotimanducaceae bacterium]|jgi:CheY-like chemotaxis protein
MFFIVRLQNKQRLINELEAKHRAPAPKIIQREDTALPPVQTKKKSTQVTAAKPVYFDSSDSLIATLSHELKTPLNGIMGIAQMMREEDEENSQLIEMEGCAHHMHSVLDTLTNLARIQKEVLPQYREWVSLRDTIEQVRQDTTFRASGRQLKILTEHENNRIRLRGDSDHISTIIKSTVLGSIEAVPMTGLPEEKQTLSIAWKTNAEEIEISILNPFEILEDQREQSVDEILNLASGAGQSRIKIEHLHLAVAKELLSLYQGSLAFEKIPTGGVRTTLRFTMKQMVASPSAAKPIGGLRVQSGASGLKTLRELPEKMKILVAEDDRASRNLLILLLQKMGQEATQVENGEQAVLALQKDPSYDLILMDVDMPIMDGTAATQAIREGLAGEEVKDIPIVAITAFNVLSDRSRFKEVGMQYYLPKPIGLKELRATLLEIIKSKREA